MHVAIRRAVIGTGRTFFSHVYEESMGGNVDEVVEVSVGHVAMQKEIRCSQRPRRSNLSTLSG